MTLIRVIGEAVEKGLVHFRDIVYNLGIVISLREDLIIISFKIDVGNLLSLAQMFFVLKRVVEVKINKKVIYLTLIPVTVIKSNIRVIRHSKQKV